MFSPLIPQNPHLIHDCLAKLHSSGERRSGVSLLCSSGERGEKKITASLGFVSILHNEEETCQTAKRLQHDDVHPRSYPALDLKLNFRLVIGILSHPGDSASGRLSNATNDSYIAASYVKFVESTGVKVIPFIYNEPAEILDKVILLPFD
ncbi:hypothetical protein LguiA_023140 [Lonicera macranthoides]